MVATPSAPAVTSSTRSASDLDSVTSARDGTTEPTAARTEVDGLAMGDVTDLTNFLGAVIDRRAFDRLAGVQRAAAADRR
jgi:hypothetical protein